MENMMFYLQNHQQIIDFNTIFFPCDYADENRPWPPAAYKAGNLAPASSIMSLLIKICEAHGSWRWEAPHPGNWLCLQAPGLRVTRPERTSAAMSAARWPRHGAGTVRVRVRHAWPVKTSCSQQHNVDHAPAQPDRAASQANAPNCAAQQFPGNPATPAAAAT